MLHRFIGGKIWAENNPDKGAVFCFKILLNPMKLKRSPLLPKILNHKN
jgi:hypothetical protein